MEIKRIIDMTIAIILFVLWIVFFSNGTLESYIISGGLGWLIGVTIGDVIFSQ